MFPIAIVAGVIGALVSTAQGASWLSDHVDSSKSAASAGGKAEAKPETDARTSSSFEAALAAQVTGQSMPANNTVTPSSSNVTNAQQHATGYDTLERTKAGIEAYSHIAEKRVGHAQASQGKADDSPITRS